MNCIVTAYYNFFVFLKWLENVVGFYFWIIYCTSNQVFSFNRLDCLRRIAKGKADFAVLTAEDLVTAANLRIEVLITNELKYNDG